MNRFLSGFPFTRLFLPSTSPGGIEWPRREPLSTFFTPRTGDDNDDDYGYDDNLDDRVRAKFYKTFGTWEVVNLHEPDKKPTSQLFVDKYLSLSQSGTFSESELWDRTVSELENEGVDLKGDKPDDAKTGENSGIKKISFTELFNNDSTKSS